MFRHKNARYKHPGRRDSLPGRTDAFPKPADDLPGPRDAFTGPEDDLPGARYSRFGHEDDSTFSKGGRYGTDADRLEQKLTKATKFFATFVTFCENPLCSSVSLPACGGARGDQGFRLRSASSDKSAGQARTCPP